MRAACPPEHSEPTLFDGNAAILAQAFRVWRDRQNGLPIPGNTSMENGIWRPTAAETCGCCMRLRLSHSRLYRHPHTLKTHCKSLRHVANLHHISETALRRYAAEVRREEQDA